MADVGSTLASWSSSDNSNSPSGTTAVSSGLDDNLRALQGVVVRGLSHKGSDIASAATTDLGAVEGLMHDITGTTTITSFGTVRAGILKVLKYEGALTLTHNATSLILLGAENRTTADGDTQIVISEGSGNWREIAYFPVAINPGKMVSTDEAQTLTNKTLTTPTLNGALAGTSIATQAEQETGTAADKIVTPGRQHFHPSAAKFWLDADAAGNINASYNMTSITDNGTGSVSGTIATDFSSANWCFAGSIFETGATAFGSKLSAKAAGTFTFIAYNSSTGAATDPTAYHVMGFGDHA